MKDFAWTRTAVENLRPGDVVSGCVHEPGDGHWTVVLVDHSEGMVLLYTEEEPDAMVCSRRMLQELRVDLDEWIAQEEATHNERMAHGGY